MEKNFCLYVYDSSFLNLAIIDNYKSLIWTDRYSRCGDFELELIYTKELYKLFKNGLYCRTNYSDRWGVIEKIEIHTDDDSPTELIISGRSLECILDRRIILSEKKFGDDDTEVSIQDSIKTLITENFINPSNVNRKVSNFIFTESTDTAITSLKFSEEYDGEDLLSVIEGICTDKNIGYKITVNNDDQFVFELYKSKDRSARQTDNECVVFAPYFDNLYNSSFYTASNEYKNLMIIDKSNNSQVIVSLEEESEPIGINRCEVRIDAKDLKKKNSDRLTDKFINTKARKKLKEEYSFKTTFEGEIIPEKMFKYGEDYFIGDVVQFADAFGNKKPLQITELVISGSEEGFQMVPSFEDPEEKERELNA